MNIVVLIDPETYTEEDPQFDRASSSVTEQVEYHISDALDDQNHTIKILPFDPDIEKSTRLLKEAAPDLVFNLTEHVGGDRSKDLHVTALLELLNLPYTGSGPKGLMLCRDKATCKRLLSHHKITVPNFENLRVGKNTLTRKLHYPLIVKPALEDGSDGISLASLVQNPEDLAQRAFSSQRAIAVTSTRTCTSSSAWTPTGKSLPHPGFLIPTGGCSSRWSPHGPTYPSTV